MKEFLTPKTIIYGEGALRGSGEKLSSLGSKALLVTDQVMSDTGYVSRVSEILDKVGVEYAVFNEVNEEPTDKIVEKGLKEYQENGCDFIVSLGGGSPIDAAKAIGVMATNDGKISDYMGQNKVTKAIPPQVSIPTTAGTGSEATKFTIIADTENDVKMLIASPYVLPDIAIVDSELTMTVPKKFTAATGIDALTHAIEAYTSVKNQPLTDTLALSAIRRIATYLRRAWANGSDQKARSEMMLASLEAGMAFCNSSVTIVHGMSRPIGAVFHVPHGVSNAVLLPTCMEFAVLGTPERFADVAEAMGIKTEGMNVLDASRAGVKAVKELCDDIEIPSITELGIDQKEFMNKAEKMAKDAIASGSPNNTARKPSVEDIVKLYEKSL